MESPKPVEITGMRSFQKNAKTPLLNQKRGNQSKNGESNGKTGSITGNCIALKGRKSMRKKDFKGRCQKKAYSKCEGVAKAAGVDLNKLKQDKDRSVR